MRWFFLIYCFIYGSMHLIVLRKIRLALQPRRRWLVVASLLMVTMIFAPILIRVAERSGVKQGLHLFSFVSFSWMGMIFLFLMLYLAFDIVLLSRFFLPIHRRKEADVVLGQSRKKLFYIILLLSCSFFGYGLFEATNLKRQIITIVSPKLANQKGKIRIVQISDVHLGLLVGEAKLERIVEAVKREKPDILVSTGDLVDGQPNNLVQETEIFKSLRPPLGKIAVTGNHEFYAGLEHSLDFTREAGFTILRHHATTLAGINFVGVDDRTAKRYGQGLEPKEQDLLANQLPNNFTILLKHQPIIEPESIGHFDLQLSGHTHKGQIFPFNLIVYLFFPYRTGRLVDLHKGQLYINPGSATWGPPIRFFTQPEITVIDLLPEKVSESQL